MKFGLSENIINEMNSIFESFSVIDEVLLFGSRAIGNFRNGSDIDLAIKSQSITHEEYLSILSEFEQHEFLYKIDLINYNSIKEKAILDHIARFGIVFYSKKHN